MVLARHEEDAARIKVLALHGMSRGRLEAVQRRGLQALLRRGGGLQVQHDGPAGGDRHPPARARRAELAAAPADLASATTRRSRACRSGCPAPPAPDTRHAYHLYTLLIDEERTGISRDAFLEAMTRQNIGVGVHYLSIPEHPYYQRDVRLEAGGHPHAARIGRQTVSIPLSAKLTDEDVDDVIAAVQRCLAPR